VLAYQNLSGAYLGYALSKAENLVNFFWWMVTTGQSASAALYYVPLPPSIVAYDEAAVTSMTFDAAGIPRCGSGVTPQSYAVTFSETGLPGGTSWTVSMGGASPVSSATSTSGTLSFSESNGTYPYRISDVPGWHQSTLPYSGNVTVSGGAVSEESLAFARVTYSVTFTESGLPNGAAWTVSVGGVPVTSTMSSLSFTEPNGSYEFVVGSVPGYTVNRSAVPIDLSGAPASVPLLFSSNPTHPSTFLNLPNDEGYLLVGGILAVMVALVALALVRRRRRGPPRTGSSGPPPGP
jgi:hypothetical protein